MGGSQKREKDAPGEGARKRGPPPPGQTPPPRCIPANLPVGGVPFAAGGGADCSHSPPISVGVARAAQCQTPGKGDAPVFLEGGEDSPRGAAGKRRSPSPWRGSPPAASPGTGSGVWGGRGEGEPRPARLRGRIAPPPGLRLYSQLVRLRGARVPPGIVVRELNSPGGRMRTAGEEWSSRRACRRT